MNHIYTVVVQDASRGDEGFALRTSGSSLMEAIENAMEEYLAGAIESAFDDDDLDDDEDFRDGALQDAYDAFEGEVRVYPGHFDDEASALAAGELLYCGPPGVYAGDMITPPARTEAQEKALDALLALSRRGACLATLRETFSGEKRVLEDAIAFALSSGRAVCRQGLLAVHEHATR